ncbi:MAG: peptide-methionine (S)-S-oxide reductase MsrA [Paracoccaceae bacterium]
MKRLWSIVAGLTLMVLLGAAGGSHAATERAIVAGGCFWCVEADFEKVTGVRSVVSGYTGGTLRNPTYQNHDGHYEAVEITFDNSQITYAQLIAMFLRSVDVTDAGGQFCDRGPAYRTAIFVSNAAQRAAAEAAVAEAGRVLGKEIVTPVMPASTFWQAEAYHQDYYKSSDIILTRAGPKQKKNAYTFYRQACGRDARVRQIWGNQAAFAK